MLAAGPMSGGVRGDPMSGSEVRYVNSGGVHIAYRVFGDGPLDLVLVPAFTSHLEQNHEWPGVVRWNARLVSFSRLIVFDKPVPDCRITRPDRSSSKTPCRTS